MKSAVLVTDVQTNLFDSEPAPFEAAQVISRINHITALARSVDIPIILLQHEAPGFLEPSSDGWQLHKQLNVENRDIRIRKTTGDAFLRTNLHEHLQTYDISNLIICGYASEFCIDNTTRRAVGLGYKVQLVSDAHTTHDKPHLSAAKIREHHNITLSMSPAITAVSTDELKIQ